MIPEPDWLAEVDGEQAKLAEIMGAVARCHLECPAGGGTYTGPHLTTSMAGVFLGQMLTRARSAEREACAVLAERVDARSPAGDHAPAMSFQSFANLLRGTVRKPPWLGGQ